MGYKFDPEVESALRPRMEMKAQAGPVAVHDVATRRSMYGALFGMLNETTPVPTDVTKQIYHTKTLDGHNLELTWFTKTTTSPTTTPGPAILHIHGGGMILASVTQYNFIITNLVGQSGTPFLSVEYRYAPEHPHPTPVEDCFAGLTWLRDNAASLSPPVNPTRIGVYGDSGGGGIAAGLNLLARDRKFSPPIAKQILIYPMLDDRTVAPPNPEILNFITWSYEDNLTGWTALLGEARGQPNVSPYAAAARAEDVSELPPTYMDVGELDIFCDEDVEYAKRMKAAGVNVDIEVYPGVPHAWEFFAREAEASRKAIGKRIEALKSF